MALQNEERESLQRMASQSRSSEQSAREDVTTMTFFVYEKWGLPGLVI